MNRRTLLTTIASLPLLGWMKPKRIGKVGIHWQVDGWEKLEAGFREAHRQMAAFRKAVESSAMTANEARERNGSN